jgi:hypothetical protein
LPARCLEGDNTSVRHDVVLIGFRLNATLKPAQALEIVLGLDAQTAKNLSRRFPASVLEGVSREHAERAAADLTAAGAKVELRPSRLERALGDAPADPGRASAAQARAPAAASNGYALGEILAPSARTADHNAIELESPLDALAVQSEQMRTRPSAVALFDEPAAAQASPPSSEPEPTPAPLRRGAVEVDASAFSGLRNLGDGLDDIAEDAPAIEVDQDALRSIQRTSEETVRRPARQQLRPKTGWAWLRMRLSAFTSFLTSWVLASLTMSFVASITLAAVAYAMDPGDMLGALGLGWMRVHAAPLLGVEP